MSGPILERAKTGRSTCRSSGMAIDEGSWRVGIEAYRAGRMTMTWIKPRCFLDDLVVRFGTIIAAWKVIDADRTTAVAKARFLDVDE